MSTLEQGKHAKVYSIQVSGIRCTNCAAKIKNGLTEGLAEPGVKVAVNIIQEKISLTIFKDSSAQAALEILKKIGFPAIGEPVPISGNEENHRTIAFLVHENELSKVLADRLSSTLGVLKTTTVVSEGKRRVSVTYNCEMIHGK